ncbi:glycosyltransferase, partial [Rhodoplanes sp. SY1]|uniref:glycosyltransferase n=1 Tax=Rhodoplanes sp. SY1 TaxID=3166646 RepID=UPI0038B46FBE
ALALPSTWIESLTGVLPKVMAELRRDGIVPRTERIDLPAPVAFVRSSDEIERSPPFYVERAVARRTLYRPASPDLRLSLITTVYDTDPVQVADLAATVFGQDHDQPFEWCILDNGSSRPETRDVLAKIARDPRVRLDRVERNLGIIGGMRRCLLAAGGDYVLPVDSDDLIFPDGLRTVASFLEQAGRPPLIYTDEDRTDGTYPRDPYIKPDWDPVLFVHSCYIAHLTAFDRQIALAVGCYDDARAEGSHDWDTFMRFLAAGHVPLHLPEILYSWRMHAASTAMNFRSKPYIYDSQISALEKFLASRGRRGDVQIAPSPLFGGAPDWRFEPRAEAAPSDGAEILAGRLATAPVLRLPAVVS